MKHSKMYRAAQSGFTLIELMITLTIVGLIALIAAPIFTDYAIRARVAEVSSVFAPIKTAVSVQYATDGRLSGINGLGDLANAPYPTVGSYAGEHVASLNVGPNGEVTITMDGGDDLGDAATTTIIYTPSVPANSNSLTWAISSASTMPEKYRP